MLELSELGFSSFFENQLKNSSFDHTQLVRITAEHRNEYEYLSIDGAGKAHLPKSRSLEHETMPKVGDWVVLDETDQISQVLTRKTTLTRGTVGNVTTSQILAANVDVVFIVVGLDSKFRPNKIERYLSVVWSSGATPVVVLNKSDLHEDAYDLVMEAEGHSPGVQVILSSSLTTEGLNEIRAQLGEGITAAFIGPSGVGKSTLINALTGDERMDTGSVREVDSKGRHTTVHRQLIVLPDGSIVIDTPGLRELQLAEGDGIASVFPEIEALVDQCRFRDCTHHSEPGCAVKEAVEEGAIKRERYDHYLKLHHDAQSFELRQDEHQRRQSEKIWGKYRREGKLIQRFKGSHK